MWTRMRFYVKTFTFSNRNNTCTPFKCTMHLIRILLMHFEFRSISMTNWMTLLLRLIPRNASHGIYRNTFYPYHTYFVILQEIETYLIDTKTHHFSDYRFFCGIYFRCLHFLSITPDHIKLMQTSIHLQPIEMNQLNLFKFLFKYYSNSFWFKAFLSVGLKHSYRLVWSISFNSASLLIHSCRSDTK